ncbi:MAG: ParB/RepB/Spo0J family partition protein, partial [Anaerolineales bacterium]
NRQRREKMTAFAAAVGKYILVRGDVSAPALCRAVESDHLLVEVAPGLEQAVYPEAVAAIFDELPPAESGAAALNRDTAPAAKLEPNQALALANSHFPAAARLRKSGYRILDHVLILNFDFPDSAHAAYANEIADLEKRSGWTVEVIPETNQSALNALAREVLPEGWQIVKGPAIHREQKRVALTVVGRQQTSEVFETSEVFRRTSGWELTLTITAPTAAAPVLPTPAGERMEINAAYGFIKAALAGSTLYRASLKDDEIMLSFISPQVAGRYQGKIAELSQQSGWRLAVNPQPNQGAILEAARALVARAGLTLSKGPSIYPEKAEVGGVLAAAVSAEQLAEITEAFLGETGFRLNLTAPPPTPKTESATRNTNVVEIPLKLIRLNGYWQSITLDPAKLEKAVERARQMGITPPIQVRRLRDGYTLVDGLYRLRAAEALGLEKIPALVE